MLEMDRDEAAAARRASSAAASACDITFGVAAAEDACDTNDDGRKAMASHPVVTVDAAMPF